MIPLHQQPTASSESSTMVTAADILVTEHH